MSRESSRDATDVSGRSNQRARTRAALLAAAAELVQEGRPPSIADAAGRALISVATAYRYFASAEALWSEAALQAADLGTTLAAAHASIDAAGPDVQRRVQVNVEAIGWHMLDNELPFRLLAKGALDQWFAQQELPDVDRAPVREGRRNVANRLALAPLEGRIADADLERLVAALGMLTGTEALIALRDVAGLDTEDAKQLQCLAARWLIAGALADLGVDD
jgi:AcrR family transcriptional regulator